MIHESSFFIFDAHRNLSLLETKLIPEYYNKIFENYFKDRMSFHRNWKTEIKMERTISQLHFYGEQLLLFSL